MTTTEQKAALLSLLLHDSMTLGEIKAEIGELREYSPATWRDFPENPEPILRELRADGRVELAVGGRWRWLPAPVERQATLFC